MRPKGVETCTNCSVFRSMRFDSVRGRAFAKGGLLRWKGQFPRTVRDAMRMAAPMIKVHPGTSQAISEGLSWEPVGISRGAPTNGTCPDVRLFLSIEQYLTRTTLQAGWTIVDRVLGQVPGTFGKVCQAFRPCALNLAKSPLAFFA